MSEVLERLASTGAVQRGGVVVIGLDAVRDRLGDRWSARSQQIWDAVDRHLDRRLGPDDVRARIGDVQLLLATSGSREAALGLGLNLLKELLTFFLGAQTFGDLKISRVLSVGGGRVSSEPLCDAEIIEAEEAAGPPRTASGLAPNAVAAWSAPSFTASDGRELEVRFEQEDVHCLAVDSFTGAATAIRSEIWDLALRRPLDPTWRRQLTLADELRIDLAVVDAAHVLCAGDPARTIILPFTLQSLVSVRGRAALISRLGALSGSRRLIGEIIGADAGTPSSSLAEAISVLKRHCRSVVVRGHANRGCVDLLRECRPQAISLDCQELPSDERGLLAAMCSFRKAVRPFCPHMLMLGLPSMAAGRLAAAVGASHASVRRGGEARANAA